MPAPPPGAHLGQGHEGDLDEIAVAVVDRDDAGGAVGLTSGRSAPLRVSLGDVGAALKRVTPEELGELYASLSLELMSYPDDRLGDVAIQQPGVVNVSEGETDTQPQHTCAMQVLM